jgi:hypothetical protein
MYKSLFPINLLSIVHIWVNGLHQPDALSPPPLVAKLHGFGLLNIYLGNVWYLTSDHPISKGNYQSQLLYNCSVSKLSFRFAWQRQRTPCVSCLLFPNLLHRLAAWALSCTSWVSHNHHTHQNKNRHPYTICHIFKCTLHSTQCFHNHCWRVTSNYIHK